jgi:tryptophan halogenase
MKKIVVVGGGLAGWLTSLYLKTYLLNVDITVIESKEIGILGAGEGTVPYVTKTLEYLGLSTPEMIKDCDATIKNGIKFTNWNNQNEYFYHSFFPGQSLSFKALNNKERDESGPVALFKNIDLSNNVYDSDFYAKLSDNNKVAFIHNNKKITKNDPLYANIGTFAVHFSAVKIADKLKKVAQSKGIKTIEASVSDICLDNNNNVEFLLLDNNTKVYLDFVFDCTGFHRLIIGKMFKSKWKSYSEHLPSDSALPFFIKMDKNIPPYTEAIAMKYGWMWKIPLQTRYGCGYVYDSSLITEQQAAQEIEEYLGFEPEYPRKNKGSFKFQAGYYEESWTNNCIAMGLSAGFIEPLEATAIATQVSCLDKLCSRGPEWLVTKSNEYRNEYNQFVKNLNENTLSFIYFHYMSQRKDTEFWKKFTEENAPKDLKKFLNILKYRVPNVGDDTFWDHISWIVFGFANNKLNKEFLRSSIEFSALYNKNSLNYQELLDWQNENIKMSIDHGEFLESFK